METLWSPWRYRYITKASPSDECIFCSKPRENNDEAALIVHRDERVYVILNAFPYTSGHLMVAPYRHVDSLAQAPEEDVLDMMRVGRRAEGILREIYKPGGLNLGMNLGECAGAGVAGHIHMHVLPRWTGDANFMSTVGETRVLPEELPVTYEKLKRAFAK